MEGGGRRLFARAHGGYSWPRASALASAGFAMAAARGFVAHCLLRTSSPSRAWWPLCWTPLALARVRAAFLLSLSFVSSSCIVAAEEVREAAAMLFDFLSNSAIIAAGIPVVSCCIRGNPISSSWAYLPRQVVVCNKSGGKGFVIATLFCNFDTSLNRGSLGL